MKSVITDQTEYCFFCGDHATQEHHLIFGAFGSGRNFAERHGLKVPICVRCHTASESLGCRIHDNPMAEHLSKMFGQALYEREMILKGQTLEEAQAKMIAENGKLYY